MDLGALLFLSASVLCVMSPEFATSVLVIHRSNSSSSQAKKHSLQHLPVDIEIKLKMIKTKVLSFFHIT